MTVKKLSFSFFLSTMLLLASTMFSAFANECPDVLKHMKRKLNSQEVVNLCEQYAGKTILFVNTASKCGFTPQFEALEKLYDTYKDDNFVVLGFPSNDFKQEHSDEAQTAEVCELTYGVTFPMFEPISIRGKNADPIYVKLAEDAGKEPKWNFNKYLVSKDGQSVVHYGSRVNPLDKKFTNELNKLINDNK